MAKLSDTQLVILNTAAKRDSRLALPLSRTLRLNPGSITKVFKSLIAKELLEERIATKDEKDWRSDDAGRYTLVITNSGLNALGIEDEDAAEETLPPSAPSGAKRKRASKAGPNRKAGPGGSKTGGKLAGVLDLVRRSNGASIVDLQKATGWQSHSVRAALTGFRKQGVEIARTKNGDGVTIYTAAQA